MKERLGLILLAAISLSACNEQKDTNNSASSGSGTTGRSSYSVFGQIRPKLDPNVVREIEQEDLEKQQQKQAELEKQLAEEQKTNGSTNAPVGFLDPSKRNLPEVGQTVVASGTLPSGTLPVPGSNPPAMATPQAAPQPMETSWQPPAGNMQAPAVPGAATYGGSYTSATPGTGFVPPPPAVTVSGSVQPFGGPPPPEMQYAANPYPYPYPYPQQQPYQPPAPDKMARSANSMFANNAAPREEEEAPKKKEKNIVVITPTGMPPYSQYKQRDDLKALWQGTLTTSLKSLVRDDKIAQDLKKVDVNLPAEPTKGLLSVSQRTQDALFKNATVDKKFVTQVKKSQSDLIQAYYRYLFSYNKFSLTQQNVAARKQEMELADSSAEKQRAAADCAQAQQEAESSKEDMRSAQSDLAAVAGSQSARLVIGRVSGVAPSLETLAQAEPDKQNEQQESSIGGFFNSVGSALGLNSKKQEREEEKVAKAESKVKDKDKEKDKGKDKKKGKGDKTQIAAAVPQEQPVPSRSSTSVESAAVSPAPPQGAVSFELKDVKTTPRKSILRVSIRNNGGENFSFDTDSVSVSEGNNKLADAAVRAEFDATIIQPSQEVTGTITIFGRPWNDKLSVSLSDGGKTILLHR